MNAHSNDLRRRVLNYSITHSLRQTAGIFQVSINTVRQIKKLYYETGGVAPRPPQAVHAHAVSPEGELFLKVILLEDVDMTLDELCERYEKTFGVRVGITTMHNTLERLNITFKKKTFYDPKRNSEEAKDEKISYINQLEDVKPEDRVYLDEMGSALNMNLEYGRSRQGERVYDGNPTAPGATVNAVAVLTEKGIEAVDTYGGSLTAKRFVLYLDLYLLDLLLGGKVLIMDNHPVHCAKIVRRFLEEHNILYAYLPTYSPELNPIEEAFSKVKHYIRKQKPRTGLDLINTIKDAVKTVTQDDVIGYVNHAEEFLSVSV